MFGGTDIRLSSHGNSLFHVLIAHDRAERVWALGSTFALYQVVLDEAPMLLAQNPCCLGQRLSESLTDRIY